MISSLQRRHHFISLLKFSFFSLATCSVSVCNNSCSDCWRNSSVQHNLWFLFVSMTGVQTVEAGGELIWSSSICGSSWEWKWCSWDFIKQKHACRHRFINLTMSLCAHAALVMNPYRASAVQSAAVDNSISDLYWRGITSTVTIRPHRSFVPSSIFTDE